MKAIKTLFMLAGLAFAATGHTAPSSPVPPKPGKAQDFELPAPQELRLDNGLDATMVPFGTLPKVSVQVVVRTGNLNEGEKRWLADFTGKLMEEGTKQRSAKEVANAAAAMGGQVYVNVGPDETTIGGEALAEYAPDMVALLGEIVMTPALPESELERIRNDLQRQLSVMQTQAQALAQEAFAQATYGAKHPYGDIFPSEEQLKGYTIEDIRRFHEQNFGAQRTQIYVAGVFDSKAVSEAVKKTFGSWQRGPEVLTDVPSTKAEHRVILRDRPGAPQSTIILGLPVVDPSHPDYMALRVMNTILGGAFSSRITSNIRENKGYTYSPRSSLDANYRVATWTEQADVTTAHTADSLREILKEIKRLQDEPPSQEELDGIKNYLTGTFVLSNSSRGSIIGQLRHMDLHGLPEDYLNSYIGKVNAVTPEDVSRIAAKYLKSGDMTLVVVGDLETVRPQLEGLDWIKEGDLE